MAFNRDQVVAASLVGTVVVVLGFASGLGQVPTGAADRQVTAHPPQVPDHVTTTTPPVPAVHVGQPQPRAHHGTAHPSHPAPAHPSPPTHPGHPAPDHPGPDPHPGPGPTPPTTEPPGLPCDVDAISALLAGLGAVVDGLPLVSDLTGALPLLGGDGLAGVLDPAGGLLNGGLLGGGLPGGGLPWGGLLGGGLTGGGLLGGGVPTPPTGLLPGSAVGGVGGLPDLAGVVGAPTSTGALPVAGTNNARLNGLLGDRCGLLVRPEDGRIVGLLSTP